MSDINIDIDAIATDLNGKADRDLTNAVGVISSSAKSYFTGIGMPSNTYINLTLGASDASYTAPANGYFYLDKMSTKAGQGFKFYKKSDGQFGKKYIAATATQPVEGCSFPVTKGEEIGVWYSLGGATNYFRFYYAEGEV